MKVEFILVIFGTSAFAAAHMHIEFQDNAIDGTGYCTVDSSTTILMHSPASTKNDK